MKTATRSSINVTLTVAVLSLGLIGLCIIGAWLALEMY